MDIIVSVLWSSLDSSDFLEFLSYSYCINRLQRIQNSATRIVSRRPRHEHITPVLENLYWLPVQQRIMFKVVLFVFKCLNGLAPPYLVELITVKENSCSCQLYPMAAYKRRKQTTNSVTEPFLFVVLCSGTGYQSV